MKSKPTQTRSRSPRRLHGVVKCARALSDKPQDLGEHDWYYEEKKNITLVHEVLDLKTGAYIRTDQIKIPWPKMFRSIHRAYGST